MTDLKAAALSYWDRGWVPIPLRNEGSAEDRKKPAIDRWRQFQYIRPERAQVEQWWTDMPQANIALICGKVSGLVVIDFDAGENHGIDPVEFLIASDLPHNVGLVETGKGWHIYFKSPGGHVPNGVRVGRLRGVPMDVRGDGGYVVAPPSMHGSGRQYAWLQDPEDEMAVLPDAVRRAIDGSPDNDRAKEPVTADEYIKQATQLNSMLQGVSAGGRNDAAARVAGYFLKVTHRDLAAAWSLLKIWNIQNNPPLGERELHAVFQSIERADAESALDELVEAQDDEHLLNGTAWADAVRDAPPRVGIPAPSLPTLEEVGGIVPKDLIILAGRPGMGKSTIAWGIAYDAALRQKLPTVLFSTEMTSVDVARWMASRIHGEAVSRLSREQWLSTLDLISKSPITICDRGSVTVDYIERVVENLPQTKLVIIDHIQRVSSKGIDAGDNRNQALEQMTVRLKNLAKDHGCTVIILSQMNRQGALTRPTLAALRDSGGLEQEADAVFFVWSDVDDPTRNPLPVKVLIAKNRHGALREVDCLFYKHLHRFEASDLAQRMLQHAEDAKATQMLNALMRGEEPSEPREQRAADNSREQPAPGNAPGPGPVGEVDEDALLRLLD